MVIDAQIQAKLDKDGFAVVGALSDEAMSALSVLIPQVPLAAGSPFYYSLLNNDFQTNQRIQHQIQTALVAFFESHFNNYRTVTESYLIKPAQTADELFLHQDWCYTDEQLFKAYNVWIPMQDVNEENGALFFLPGSHAWFDTKRSGSLPTGRIASTGAFIHKSLVKCLAKKGEVILFNPATFHGSFPNNSNTDRLIITTTVIDSFAPFLYYQKESNETVTVHELADNFFLKDLKTLAVGQTPDVPALKQINYCHQIVSEHMLETRLKRIL